MKKQLKSNPTIPQPKGKHMIMINKIKNHVKKNHNHIQVIQIAYIQFPSSFFGWIGGFK